MKIIDQKSYSIPEVARATGVSKTWWRNQIHQGKIKYIKIGQRYFIPEEALRNVVKVINPTTPADEGFQHQTREV